MKRFAAVAVLLAAIGLNADAQEKKDTPKGFYVVSPKSRVYIQGRAWMQFEGVELKDTGSPKTDVIMTPRVSSLASYLRFRGEYDLGEKWMVWSQFESEVALDGGSVPFSDVRNTGVGLTGPYGTLQLGKWDTPFKSATIGLDPYGGTGILGYYNVFGQMVNGSGVSGNRWNSRVSNNVMYTTPRFYGVQAAVMYATPEQAVGTLRPYLLSASIAYNGPLYLVAAYEVRKNTDSGGTAPNGIIANAPNKTTDTGFRAGAGYKYAPTFTRIGAAFEWLKAANDTAATDVSKYSYWLTLTQGIFSDKHQLVFAGGIGSNYTVNGTEAADTGGKYWNLGYHFNWTSDLKLYAAYGQVSNSAAGVYTFGSGGFSPAPAFKGQTSKSYVLGIQYLF